MKRILITIIPCLFLLAITSNTVLAADSIGDPDSVSLDGIVFFEDLISDGDMLALVPYGIEYATTPNITIRKAYIFSMISANGTILGQQTAYPYQDNGYGDPGGVVGFYFEDQPGWDENYTFRLSQNPIYFDTPQYWDFVTGTYTDADDHQLALKAELIEIATELSDEWGIDLLTSESGLVTFSTYGELYFENAIPSLSQMAPGLYEIQVRNPTYTKRSWDYTIAEALQTKYAGTWIYDDFMSGFAGMFSISVPAAMNFISIIMFAALVIVSVKWFKGTTISSFMDGYALLILLMLSGFFSMILNGFIAFVSTTVGGVILFLNRS